MTILNIVCLPDLLRGIRTFPESFFELIREPILQGAGLDIRSNKSNWMIPASLDLTLFRKLSGILESDCTQTQWFKTYHQIADEAVEYLFECLPSYCLIISFEMPPWLIHACNEREVSFIDMRVSPLRFGRDLYIALRCSDTDISKRIMPFAVLDEELRLEASTLSANMRMHQRRLEDERNYRFQSLEDSLVFIGQAPYDASLLASDGRSLRSGDFTDQLQRMCKDKRLLHKAHPFALEFAEEEREQLEKITGCEVLACHLSAYQILSSRSNVGLVGISSGLLQEAAWFDKPAHVLFQPYVPLASVDEVTTDAYQQIHFHTFLSPEFWHQVLTPEQQAPRLARLTPLAHHHARETFNHWWDYSKVLTWERTLPYESFMRSSGAEFRSRITQLENKINILSTSSLSYSINESKDDRLKLDLLISLYSRLASDYQCSEDVFSKNKSPAIYINKNLNAEYYQELHDKNILFKSNNWLMPYLELIADKKYRIVREIGCGNGAFSSAIAKSVDKVIGLDWAKSPDFPEAFNIVFEQKDITKADLEAVDLNCSADVLEHIEPEKLPLLIKSLNESSKANFHVIACYDDGHSHLSIFPPDAWLFLFKQVDPNYRILDISIRHDDISNIVCVVSNI